MPDKSELKVGDWVRLNVVGLNDEKYEPIFVFFKPEKT